MSRSFLGIPINNLKGNITSFPIKLCGQSGKVIPVSIDWSLYGGSTAFPNQNVVVNLRGNSQQKLLENVRSVYIDNTGSTNPIYIFFPDTGYAVTAAPGAEVWAPCYTNGEIAWIICEGMVTNFIPTTLVMFTDVFVQPFTTVELATAVPFYLASPTLARTQIQNASYGTPALGDQADNTTLLLGGTGNQAQVFVPSGGGSLTPSKYIIVTGLFANVRLSGANDAGSAIDLSSPGFANPVYSWSWNSFAGIKGNFSFPGATMNLKLDGALQYFITQVSAGTPADFFVLQTVFTQSNI